MPRVARKKSKSKIYHIMIRGINQQNIFSVDEDYEKFIAILFKYHKKSEYEIYARKGIKRKKDLNGLIKNQTMINALRCPQKERLYPIKR